MAGLHAAGQLVAEVVHDTTTVTVPYRVEPSVSVRPLGQGLARHVFVAGHNDQVLGRLRQTLTTPELLFALVFGADLERAMEVDAVGSPNAGHTVAANVEGRQQGVSGLALSSG